MPLSSIFDNLRAKASGRKPTPSANDPIDENAVLRMTETLYDHMISVMSQYPQLQQEDFEFEVIKTQLLRLTAQYLTQPKEENTPFLKPLFISGIPGIGKTTLLMIVDEVLYPLGRSCRDMVASGDIVGYFVEKAVLHITPLQLFGKPTGMLSARDWNNILRHWTFEENLADTSEVALGDFISRLEGKVVFVDEAELEGYVYFSELLGQHGILVILTSNLEQDQIHLPPDHVRVISLAGKDHRVGDILKVCLPNRPHPLFDPFAAHYTATPKLYFEKMTYEGNTLVYYDWRNLKNQPQMKDDFARHFVNNGADVVLLDSVPFFEDVPAETVNLTFLGHLSRFVNFVDAIHDCRLPLLVRGTQTEPLDPQTAGQYLQPLLLDYDQRVGGHDGEAGWIEWTRCLSRLRSHEALNAQIWPVAKTSPVDVK